MTYENYQKLCDLGDFEASVLLKRQAAESLIEHGMTGLTPREALAKLVPNFNPTKFGPTTWPVVEAIYFLDLSFQIAKKKGEKHVN